jgi:hypothetical protein
VVRRSYLSGTRACLLSKTMISSLTFGKRDKL